jgi:LPXTG-motif cell wall-anchored protein
MTRANARLTIISAVAFVLGLIFTMPTPASASADGQIVVARPDGSAPGKLFTDLTFVPGDTKTEKLVVSQTTEADVTTGIRFESTSPHGPLHDSAEVTISGFGDSVSSPLGEALDTESPFWLGTLSPSDKESITISVHLPESAGNDTKREQARFRVIVTAQGDGVGPTPPPKDATADSDDSASSEADASSSDHDEDSSADDGREATATSDSTTNGDESTAADGGSGSGADSDAGSGSSSDAGGKDRGEANSTADTNADSDSDADGSLPRTGLRSLPVLFVGAGLLFLGTLAVSIVRRRRDRTGS